VNSSEDGLVVLVVLDGFGIGDGGSADATARAHAPFLSAAREQYPYSIVETSGESVGLPPGQMGNSEVGHMTIGAGRVIPQNITRITQSIERGELATNPAIQGALSAVEASRGTLHLMGLVSDGGVHSHMDQLALLFEHLRERGVQPAVHAFLDGRDTPPRSALGFIQTLQTQLAAIGGRIATVTGRYYAMDRDNRWDRVSKAYHAIVCGEGASAPDAAAAVEAAYARDESDEFVRPTVVGEATPIADGDAVIFFNFRADRARELTAALTNSTPERFEGELERKRVPQLSHFVCFTDYDEKFDLPVAFPTPIPANSLGEVVARQGLQQLRIAETEKYAHVTFFFNGGLEAPFPGEDRALIPSPRDVATYDHKPEMSAFALTDEVVRRITSEDYGFVLLNYANPDMVGHTGVLDAAVKAVETVDRGLERIAHSVLALGGSLLITADHGNCELMVDPESGDPHTAHTTNPVPLYWIARDAGDAVLRDGALSDLAPTVLDLLGLSQPEDMSGRSLIVRD
jgi:2,3-bisphosphoglycerate-independent phosphoglycerate mutase